MRARGTLGTAALLAGCALLGGEGEPHAGPPPSEELAGAGVIVLPVRAVVLPPAGETSPARDSLAAALASFTEEALANALEESGAAASARAPRALAGTLAAVGPERLEAAGAAAGTAGPLPDDAARTFRELATPSRARFLLLPRSLVFSVRAPLRFEAVLETILVDAPAGRVAWLGRVVAENPVAPPGSAENLLGATLREAAKAAADRTAARLGGEGPLEDDAR